MAISPSRMPQPPNMMGAHANNIMAQAPAQNQFLPQNQFQSSSGAMSVNSVGMGQPAAQTGVPQVPCTRDGAQLSPDSSVSHFVEMRIPEHTFQYYVWASLDFLPPFCCVIFTFFRITLIISGWTSYQSAEWIVVFWFVGFVFWFLGI